MTTSNKKILKIFDKVNDYAKQIPQVPGILKTDFAWLSKEEIISKYFLEESGNRTLSRSEPKKRIEIYEEISGELLKTITTFYLKNRDSFVSPLENRNHSTDTPPFSREEAIQPSKASQLSLQMVTVYKDSGVDAHTYAWIKHGLK